MAKQKYYVVWAGRKPGVYTSWADCQEQINQFQDAKYKSYESQREAEAAYKEGWKAHWGQGRKRNQQADGSKITPQDAVRQSQSSPANAKQRRRGNSRPQTEIDFDSISVDVGTRGNPGPVEYKGVDTRTGEVIFEHGPIQKGTNNLGEFLAIVHALAYLKKLGSNKTIYSDSVNAMKWVKQKSVSTTLKRDESTEEMWNLVDRAVEWLNSNTYSNQVLKWETESWGEIKADYGRK